VTAPRKHKYTVITEVIRHTPIFVADVPRDDPAWAENPNIPWEPNVWPAPIDCQELDRAQGR
jgi:hypothetical protein